MHASMPTEDTPDIEIVNLNPPTFRNSTAEISRLHDPFVSVILIVTHNENINKNNDEM